MFTERDNLTYDLYKYLSLLTIVVGLTLVCFDVVAKDKPFDLQSFGIGFGALFVGMGAALKLKQEPATKTTGV